ncbi:MAG: DRTGG domain-containing protein [Eubacteriaceae bacterium]|nr:DRTGG domain-containing protein [Eubacteriaceae bacterium]
MRIYGGTMKVCNIKEMLEGRFVTEETEEILNHTVSAAYATDLMSEVLAYTMENAILVTGLNNPQVVRTSEMMDIPVIVFVRAKEPSKQMVALAQRSGIAIMITNHSMFNCCGILHEAGLLGGAEYGK